MKREALQKRLQESILIFDGGFGTELYRRNFFVNTSYDDLCLTSPETVTAIHQSYVDSGAEVLTTNTYNANAASLAQFGIADRVEKINHAAVAVARKAAAGKPEILIAGSVGPIKSTATAAAADQAAYLIAGGVDFLIFESISSIAELQAALSAVSGRNDIAYVVSFTFDSDALLADHSNFEDITAILTAAIVFVPKITKKPLSPILLICISAVLGTIVYSF